MLGYAFWGVQMTHIELTQGDITPLCADARVNAANTTFFRRIMKFTKIWGAFLLLIR